MASKLVVDAVTARIADNWTNCPVIAPNTSNTAPRDGSPFLTLQFPVATETIISIGPVGQRLFRESGAFRMVLAIANGAGLDDGLSWIDQLRSLFRAAQFDGVNCLGASPAFVDNSNGSGNFYRLSAVVEYYADILA